MATINNPLPNSPGLSVTAYIQGGPAAIGAQQPTSVGILSITYPTGMAINPLSSQEQFLPATLPSPAVVYQIAVPDTAGTYELTVPFKCAVISVSGIVTDGAAGDTVQIKKKELNSGTVTAISDAISLNTAPNAVVFAGVIDKSGAPPINVLNPGDNLQAVAVRGGSNCSCSMFITVIPVA